MKHPRDATEAVRFVRRKLLNPTPKALESCAPHLKAAIASLERLRQSGAAPDLSELRRELSLVKALMQSAADFHDTRWNLVFPPDEPPSGEPQRTVGVYG